MKLFQIFLPLLFLTQTQSIAQTPKLYYYQNGPSGGSGGTSFHATTNYPYKITQINVRSGTYIDAVQLVFASDQNGCQNPVASNWYGGSGGTLTSFTFDCDEFIAAIGGRYSQYIDYLYVVTSKNRTMAWGTSTGGAVLFYYKIPPNSRCQGFIGQAGDYIDAIGVNICQVSN